MVSASSCVCMRVNILRWLLANSSWAPFQKEQGLLTPSFVVKPLFFVSGCCPFRSLTSGSFTHPHSSWAVLWRLLAGTGGWSDSVRSIIKMKPAGIRSSNGSLGIHIYLIRSYARSEVSLICVHLILMQSGFLFAWWLGHLAGLPWLGDNSCYCKTLHNGCFSEMVTCQMYVALIRLVDVSVCIRHQFPNTFHRLARTAKCNMSLNKHKCIYIVYVFIIPSPLW